MGKNEKAFDLGKFFLALSDRTRLRLLNLMGSGEVCVCFFVEVLAESQPKISRHLAYLRQAGIVSARKDGKWMHSRINRPADPNAERVLRDVLAWLKEDREMQSDLARLVKYCCSPSVPVQLAGAPRPSSLAAANEK